MSYYVYLKDGHIRSNYFLDKESAEGYWEEDKIYSVTESYEFYKNYTRTRENLKEVDWDIVSVELDHADIDFIREFRNFIRWDLVDYETIYKWRVNKDPRYSEFRHELEDTVLDERSLDDKWFVDNFVKRLLEK